jgi:hypothetical protein
MPPRSRTPSRLRPRPRAFRWGAAVFSVLAATFAPLAPLAASPEAIFEGLPGDEVTAEPRRAPPPRPRAAPVADSGIAEEVVEGVNWMAPPVHEQLARDPVLIALGKGALFVPTYSEPRREPELAVFDAGGRLVATGQTGHRILLDSGNYEVRFGSGVTSRRLRAKVRVDEGRTNTVPPTWGGLLVETLLEDGAYDDGQYDLIRMEEWVNYGRGQGYKEERLQDIDVWILPPGLYRISKVGEGYNSLRNYITVQINPGELHSVEIVFSQDGSLIAGGVKSLNTRARAGQYWTYGLRAGGNASFARAVDQANDITQSVLFSTDMRLRARYDRSAYFGITELFLQNSFSKAEGQPFTTTTDDLRLRSTWVRRLNNWLGPYVRGQVSTHLFPTEATLDTVYVTRLTGAVDTIATGGTFEWQPSFYPLLLAQGAGVNIEWLSRYEAEISTQIGLAARQRLSRGDYELLSAGSFQEQQTTREVGAEGVLNGRLRLSSQFTLDLRAEVLAANANVKNTKLENFEADLRFFITRNIEIGYLFQTRETEEADNRFPRTHSLSLRLSFNY